MLSAKIKADIFKLNIEVVNTIRLFPGRPEKKDETYLNIITIM